MTGFMLIDSLRSGDPGAFRSALLHLVLPAIALGTIPLAVIARMTRSAMLEVLNEDYVRTARAKGLSPLRVVGLHALRNALIPVITVIGLQVGSLFGGAVLTETIFAWPGVGNWLIQGIDRRDYPVLQGGILLVAGIIILVNLTVDVLAGVINPAHSAPAMSATAAIPAAPEPAAPFADFRRHFAASRSGMIGLTIVVLLALAALFAPLLAPHGPDEQMRQAILHPPSWLAGQHPLGTDDVGRDVLSRLLYGARLSLSIGATVMVQAFVVGTLLGLVAGFFGGVPGALVMRLIQKCSLAKGCRLAFSIF